MCSRCAQMKWHSWDNRAPPKLRTLYPPALGQGDELRSQTLGKAEAVLTRQEETLFPRIPRNAMSRCRFRPAPRYADLSPRQPLLPCCSWYFSQTWYARAPLPDTHLSAPHHSPVIPPFRVDRGMNDSAGTMADVAQKIKMYGINCNILAPYVHARGECQRNKRQRCTRQSCVRSGLQQRPLRTG